MAPEEIARAQERLRDRRAGWFSVGETTIQGGTHVFVVGRLENGEGPLRLAADRMFGRVVLHEGSQAEFVDSVRGGAGGLGVAGWILGLGVGPLPLLILGVVVLARRRAAETRT